MAGLLAARVLSDHFQQVTLLERDMVHDRPESRKTQPQTRHLHAVLESGVRIIFHLFPNMEKDLVSNGASIGDFGEVARWYHFDGYKVQAPSGHRILMVSRPFLEWHIRRAVLKLSNVIIKFSHVAQSPILSEDGMTIIGTNVHENGERSRSRTIPADLIVDACGRKSSSSTWLKQLGFDQPLEREVRVKVGYATRLYQRQTNDLEGANLVMIAPTPPGGTRMTNLYPIENSRWIVTAGGWAGDYPPGDEQGFLEFVRSLPVLDIYHIIRQAKPLSDVITHRFPSNQRRHYEHLTRFPNGYLVIGDAVASFNPIYGQGMSSAAMQAQILSESVSQESLCGIWRSYFKHVAKVIDLPWGLTVGEDFRYPETQGEKSLTTDLINHYVAMVHRATHRDPVVYQQFLHVSNLLAPPASLMHPRILWRVLRQSLRNQKP